MKAPRQNAHTIKASGIVVTAVVTLTISGFFMGLRQTVRESEAAAEGPPSENTQAETSSDTAPGKGPIVAVSYTELRQKGFRSLNTWSSHIATLVQPPKADHDVSVRATDVAAQRNARRAFDGAPPVVPHPIDPISSASCLICHGSDMMIDGIQVSKISHAAYASCTQCHVSREGLGEDWNTLSQELHQGSQFVGLTPPTQGQRAFPGAPPTIPHSTWMREDCMSCHGPNSMDAMRTTHPERSQCLQCHAVDARMDQRQVLENPFPRMTGYDSQPK